MLLTNFPLNPPPSAFHSCVAGNPHAQKHQLSQNLSKTSADCCSVLHLHNHRYVAHKLSTESASFRLSPVVWLAIPTPKNINFLKTTPKILRIAVLCCICTIIGMLLTNFRLNPPPPAFHSCVAGNPRAQNHQLSQNISKNSADCCSVLHLHNHRHVAHKLSSESSSFHLLQPSPVKIKDRNFATQSLSLMNLKHTAM